MEEAICPDCRGYGWYGTMDPVTMEHIQVQCDTCEGTGKILVNAKPGNMAETSPAS